MSEPFNFTVKKILKMPDIFRHAVCHRTLEAIPNELVRIKIGSVTRKRIREDTAARFKKFLNRARFVDGTRIPKKNETFFEMPKKILEKNQDFGITDILRLMKLDVKADPFSFGRNADGGNSRYLRPSSGDFNNGGFAFGRPGFSNRGDETKSALIEEYQRNSKRFRLFLYGAKYGASTVLSSPHPVLWPLSQAFGSSSPFVSGTTRDGLDDTIPRNVFGSLRRSYGLSKDRWSSLSLKALPKESSSTIASDANSFLPDVPAPVLTSSLRNLSFGDPFANGEQNLRNNRFFRQQPAGLILDSTTQQHAGAAVRDAFGFHMVSWNHDSIFTDVVLLLLRKSIVAGIAGSDSKTKIQERHFLVSMPDP